MNTSFIIIILILILLLIGFIIMLFSNIFIDYNTRFINYTITSNKNNSLTLFERLFNTTWKIIKKISKILNKSEVFSKYGNSFNKYISYNEKIIKGIDYVSIKFIISILFALAYLLTTLYKVEYNIMVLLLVLITSFFILDVYFIIEHKNRRKKIEEDLLSAIIIMNNAFKSSMNIMQAVNIVENECVTICMPNTPESIALIYAINKIGAIANIIHPLSSTKDIKRALDETNSTVLFCSDTSMPNAKKIKVKHFILVPNSNSLIKVKKMIYNLKESTNLKLEGNMISWSDFIFIKH